VQMTEPSVEACFPTIKLVQAVLLALTNEKINAMI